MPDYSKGRIYRIVSLSHPNEVYYGSTTQTLGVRMCGHRKAYHKGKPCSSTPIIAYGDAIIVLVEMFPCQSVEELRAREAWYILNHDCVNKVNPAPMTTERRLEKMTRYREKHNHRIVCECGGRYMSCSADDHLSSTIHKRFVETGQRYEPKGNRIQCECGGFYYPSPSHQQRHNDTAKHQRMMKNLSM